VTDRFALVREHELRDLVERLDQAAADLVDYDNEDIVDTIRKAATYLHELRMRE